jgi:hypothetical protein
LSDCGRGLLYGTPEGIVGEWKAPECVVAVNIDGTVFTAKGTFKYKPTGGLGGLFIPSDTSVIADEEDAWKLEYHGDIRGKVIIGRVIRERIGENTSLLNSLLGGSQVLLLLSENGCEFEVMEKRTDIEPKWYKIKKALPAIA